MRADTKEIMAEFTRTSITVYGVHLIMLQAGTMTKEHIERPTEHCGIFFALSGEACIAVGELRFTLKAGSAVHCAYGVRLEIIVQEQQFEAVLVQYLPEKGASVLNNLPCMSSSFELKTGIDKRFQEQLQALCLLSRQTARSTPNRINYLFREIWIEALRLSQTKSDLPSPSYEASNEEQKLIEHLAERFNKVAFITEDVIHVAISPQSSLNNCILSKNGFLFAVRGEADFIFDERQDTMLPGSIYHGSDGARLSMIPRGEGHFEYYLIHYRFCEDQSEFTDALPDQFVLRPGLQPRITELLELLHQNAVMPGKLTGFRKKELFFSILSEVFTACQRGRFNPGQLEAVEMSMQYIHTHYADPITLDCLAQLQGMQPRQLSYLFYKSIGIRPIDYLLQYRIKRAQDLLTMSSAPIKEIAAMTGYDDPQYFSRIFRRHTGMSPSEARHIIAKSPLK